jgi:hypothetical protein
MRRSSRGVCLVVGLLGMGVLLAGCSKPENATATAAPPVPAGTTPGQKQQVGGGVPDLNLYAAPTGVQTGTQGGGGK